MGGDALQLDAIDGGIFHQYMALMDKIISFWRGAHVNRDVGVICVVRVDPVSHRDLGGVMVMASVGPVVSCCGSGKQNLKPARRLRPVICVPALYVYTCLQRQRQSR